MINFDDIEDPRIQIYRSLRYTPKIHTEQNVFVAEGEKVVVKLLKSNLTVESIFATPEYYDRLEKLISIRNINSNFLFSANKKLMEKIVGFSIHTGVMAIGKQPEYTDINNLHSPIIALNGVISSENVGSIVRNCAAFNFPSLIFDKGSSHPYLRRAVRVSMGNIFDLNINKTENLKESLKLLKNNYNFKIFSAEINEKAVTITNYKFPRNMVLVFGNEGWGIDDEILSVSDEVIKIPINHNVASINVASSSAIFLFSIYSQLNSK